MVISGIYQFTSLKRNLQQLIKDKMIGMNQNSNNVSSKTKGDNAITMEKMSNMKGM